MSLVQVTNLINKRSLCSIQLRRCSRSLSATYHASRQYPCVQKGIMGGIELVCHARVGNVAPFVLPATLAPVQFGFEFFSNSSSRRSTRCRSDSGQDARVGHDSNSSSSVMNATTGSSRGKEFVIAPTDEEPLNLRECRHFVNLTNGIEALPMLHELKLPYSFVRIQSTACEQQNLEALMAELDANLLISLALGHCCLVYDCGSRGRDGTPRALWYGLEFVRYTLSKLWLRRPCPALLRGKNVSRHFDAQIRSFRQSTIRRLKYYAKYLPPNTPGDEEGKEEGEEATGTLLALSLTASNHAAAGDGSGGGAATSGLQCLHLYGVYRPTDHDDDASYYVKMLYKYQTGQALPCAEKGCERGARTKCELHQDSQRPCVDGGVAEAAGACMLSCRTNLYRDSDMPDPDAQLAAAMATVASSGSVANEYVFSERAEESRGECSQNGGLRRRQFEREVLGNMDEERHGGAATAGDDGEAVLSWYGFRLFRRGMSPAEWSAKAATVATDG